MEETYPNDPYKDHSFAPIERGDLTNVSSSKTSSHIYRLCLVVRKTPNL